MGFWDLKNEPYAPGGYLPGSHITRRGNALTNSMIASLEDRNKHLSTDVERLTHNVEALKNGNDQLHRLNENKNERIENQRSELKRLNEQNAELREKLNKAESRKDGSVSKWAYETAKVTREAYRSQTKLLKADNDVLKSKNMDLNRRIDKLEGRAPAENTITARSASQTIPNKEDVKPGEAWIIRTPLGIYNAIRAGVTGSLRQGQGDDLYEWAIERNGTIDWYKSSSVELIAPLTLDEKRVITSVDQLTALAVGSSVLTKAGDTWVKCGDRNFRALGLYSDISRSPYHLLSSTSKLTLLHKIDW